MNHVCLYFIGKVMVSSAHVVPSISTVHPLYSVISNVSKKTLFLNVIFFIQMSNAMYGKNWQLVTN